MNRSSSSGNVLRTNSTTRQGSPGDRAGTPQESDGVYRYELDDDEDVAEAIVRVVDREVGRDLGSGSARLGDAVDPDALDALFPSSGSGSPTNARFTFEQWDCTITVSARRVLTIRPRE